MQRLRGYHQLSISALVLKLKLRYWRQYLHVSTDLNNSIYAIIHNCLHSKTKTRILITTIYILHVLRVMCRFFAIS